MLRGKGLLVCAVAALALGLAPAASADGWWPHPADATWTYQWSDSVYAPTPTTEKVTVKSQNRGAFTLAWTTDGLSNPADAVTSAGTMDFQESNSGLQTTNWSSTPPPPQFPTLCASATSCPNALSSVLYNVSWGSRFPVLQEPLLSGFSWASTGGTQTDATSSASSYLGTESITVPAFPMPVTAAKIESQVTQAGAIGDPYGSGIRTIWWVYGVGPVKIEFLHAGGAGAAVTTAVLQSTNQTPQAPPPDVDYFPFTKGLSLIYSWTNSKHMPKAELQQFTIDAVANHTASFTVTNLSSTASRTSGGTRAPLRS